MGKKNKKEATPNITLLGGPWPGRQVFWPTERQQSMTIRYGFTKKGRYVRVSQERALWEDIL